MKQLRRLRVFDWNTRWFWFTIFYKPNAYGESYFKIELWKPHTFDQWLNVWEWEEEPYFRGGYAPVPKT